MKSWGNPDTATCGTVAAINEVIVAYCRFVDLYEDVSMVALFTNDGHWLRPGKEPLRGRDEIKAYLQTRDRSVRTRHIPSNVLVTVNDAESATAVSCYTIMKSGPDGSPMPVTLGEYHDLFLLREGRWQISRRDTRHVFRAI